MKLPFHLFPGLAMFAIAQVANAQTAPTAETMLPVIEAAFAANGCAFPMSGGEMAMAEAIAAIQGTDVATVTSRENGSWDAINDAMEGLIDSGRFFPDPEAGVFRLNDCTPAN
ncbi:MAG: hypothetical protein Kow0013_29680 [Pararhodobacter sp.]